MANRFATIAEVNGPAGVAPALSELDDDTVTGQLTVARLYIGLSAWGDAASVGHALLAAHFLSLTAAAAAAGVGYTEGVVVSESDGPASRSFAAPTFAAEDSVFSTTPYGRQYVELRAIVRATLGGVLARGPSSDRWWGTVWSR